MPKTYIEKTVEEINQFIIKWTGDSASHLLDNDENDGERLRDSITQALTSQSQMMVDIVKSELMKRMMKYDSKDGYSTLHDEIVEKVYNDVEDILTSYKESGVIN